MTERPRSVPGTRRSPLLTRPCHPVGKQALEGPTRLAGMPTFSRTTGHGLFSAARETTRSRGHFFRSDSGSFTKIVAQPMPREYTGPTIGPAHAPEAYCRGAQSFAARSCRNLTRSTRCTKSAPAHAARRGPCHSAAAWFRASRPRRGCFGLPSRNRRRARLSRPGRRPP